MWRHFFWRNKSATKQWDEEISILDEKYQKESGSFWKTSTCPTMRYLGSPRIVKVAQQIVSWKGSISSLSPIAIVVFLQLASNNVRQGVSGLETGFKDILAFCLFIPGAKILLLIVFPFWCNSLKCFPNYPDSWQFFCTAKHMIKKSKIHSRILKII